MNFLIKSVALAFAFLLCGCGLTSRLKPSAPAFNFKSPAGSEVTQSGSAAVPASVATGNTVTEIPLSPGSSITINAPAVDPFNPSPEKIPVVKITEHREQITTPTAFTPPAGPTLGEQINANAVTRSYYFAGILAIICALCIWRGHIKAAVIFGAGAVVVVPLTKFISSTAGQISVLVTVCIGGTLFAAWHFMRDKNNNGIADGIELFRGTQKP